MASRTTSRVNVLGIDTATAVASIGLSREGSVLAERSERSPRGHAESLPRIVEEVLEAAGLDPAALEGIAVSVGPGSFTGLRVGLSFAKGLAYANDLPIAGVPTLRAYAEVVPERATVITCIDARKGEVYLAAFDRSDGQTFELLEVRPLPPGDAAREIAARFREGSRLLLGDAAERYPDAFAALATEGVRIVPFSSMHPRGGVIARLGEATIADHGESRPEDLVPAYVRPSAPERRRSDASLTREKTL